MPDSILDGTGTCKSAKVDVNHRLQTNSVTTGDDTVSTELGESFNLSTGELTLTDAVQTPVLYIKNNSEKDLHITKVEFGFKSSTGGGDTVQMEIFSVRTPTTGTLITDETAIDIKCNRNMGNLGVLDITVYKGTTGSTLTNGIDHSLTYSKANTVKALTVLELLPKGTAIAYKVTPPTGNTNLDMYVSIECFLKTKRGEEK